eukprot:359170-Chlamydomonas_euryale.AAC.5
MGWKGGGSTGHRAGIQGLTLPRRRVSDAVPRRCPPFCPRPHPLAAHHRDHPLRRRVHRPALGQGEDIQRPVPLQPRKRQVVASGGSQQPSAAVRPPGGHPQGLHVRLWRGDHIAQPGAFPPLQGKG